MEIEPTITQPLPDAAPHMRGLMPIALINGTEIYYEIIGHSGPWVAVMSGGRHPIALTEDLTQAIASRGYRVIVHDRRNCGRSSLDFDALDSEEDVWVDDLHALLNYLKVGQALVVGTSRSARVAIRFALHYPDQTRGLGLWGLSGGAAAARFLDDYYYGTYLRACEKGGMEAVCALDHFAGLIVARPANRDILLAINPQNFMSTMGRWRIQFLIKIDQPVMGFDDEELRRIGVPTAIVPFYDRMHPHAAATHALKMIPGSRLFDFDPARHESSTMTDADKFNDTAKVAAILCDFESSLAPRRATNVIYECCRRLFSRPGFLSHLGSLNGPR
jgi:pimeloyl-ACP methyl ester carboxylesterase